MLTLGLALFPGCSPGGYSGPTGTVSGTITRAGQPVAQGCVVSFVSPDGFTASAKVESGGRYNLRNVDAPQIPVATYKVSLAPPAQPELSEAEYEKAMASGMTGQSDAASDAIPAKYRDLSTTDLSYEVKAGSNTIDIELP